VIAYWKLTGSVAGAKRLSKQPMEVVRRWINRYIATGSVADAPKSGRRPVLSAAVGKVALDQLLSGEAGGAKSVARNLHAAGHTTEAVSRQTVVRAASKVAEKGAGNYVACGASPPSSCQPQRWESAYNSAKPTANGAGVPSCSPTARSSPSPTLG
jgi:hypothetical protein